MENYKICSKCNNNLHLSSFYKYYIKEKNTFSYKHICKKCHNILTKERLKIKENELKQNNLKKCNKCKKIKYISEFDSYNGLKRRTCKECLSEDIIKICIKCNKEKSINNFRRIKKGEKVYYLNKCKECTNEEIREKRKNRFTIYEQLQKEGIVYDTK